MFTGKSGYDYGALTHTCLINVSGTQGAFNAVMWNGDPVAKDWDRERTFHGTFTRDRNRVHVFVYGGTMKQQTITALLGDWFGGKWSKTPLMPLEPLKGRKR